MEHHHIHLPISKLLEKLIYNQNQNTQKYLRWNRVMEQHPIHLPFVKTFWKKVCLLVA